MSVLAETILLAWAAWVGLWCVAAGLVSWYDHWSDPDQHHHPV